MVKSKLREAVKYYFAKSVRTGRTHLPDVTKKRSYRFRVTIPSPAKKISKVKAIAQRSKIVR